MKSYSSKIKYRPWKMTFSLVTFVNIYFIYPSKICNTFKWMRTYPDKFFFFLPGSTLLSVLCCYCSFPSLPWYFCWPWYSGLYRNVLWTILSSFDLVTSYMIYLDVKYNVFSAGLKNIQHCCLTLCVSLQYLIVVSWIILHLLELFNDYEAVTYLTGLLLDGNSYYQINS